MSITKEQNIIIACRGEWIKIIYIFIYGCTTWTLTKRLEKKLHGNDTRMLRAILNKSWRQHPTRHQLYSRDELISDVLLWIPTHGRAKAGRPARTYIQQLCEDTGCCPEDLPRAMNDREKWRERVRDIRATSTTWWWWWWYIYIMRNRKSPWFPYKRCNCKHYFVFPNPLSKFFFLNEFLLRSIYADTQTYASKNIYIYT